MAEDQNNYRGVDQAKHIWMMDAVEKYGRSRAWFSEQVRHGGLSYSKFPGNKHLYLVRQELDEMFSRPSEEGKRRTQENAG
jgi:hypothetical protein